MTAASLKAASFARVPTGVLLAYAIPQFPHSLALLPVVNFVPAFYADQMRLPLASVGAALFTVLVIDAAVQPLIGLLSDRTHTRFGRRKPFIVLGLPILLIAVWTVFVPAGRATIGLLFAGLAALYVGFAIIDVPYAAWGAELSTGYDERTRISGWRSAFGAAGTIAALAVPAALSVWGRSDAKSALLGMAIGFVILQPLGFAFALWRTPEIIPEQRSGARPNLGRAAAAIFRNKPFLIVLASTVLSTAGLAMNATINLLFTTYIIGAPKVFGPMLFGENITSLLGLPLFLGLAKRWGKHRAFALAALVYALNGALPWLLHHGDALPFAAVRIGAGFALLGLTVLGPSLTADAVDQDTLETGEERTGLYFSLLGMATLMALAFGVLLGTLVPASAGFQPSDAVHTARALFGLRTAYSTVAPGLIVAGAAVMLTYPLTRRRQQEIRSAIEARRRGVM